MAVTGLGDVGRVSKHRCQIVLPLAWLPDGLPCRLQRGAPVTWYSPGINANEAQSRNSTRLEEFALVLLSKDRVLTNELYMQGTDHSELQQLIQHLNLLREEMLALEASGLAGCAEVHPEHTASARNLIHCLALRQHDIRHLQSQLAAGPVLTEPHSQCVRSWKSRNSV